MDAAMRSNFRFVGYWNPALTADAEGRAEFDFELPDNLTGWRVLVMGVTAEDRMGLGQAEFSVNLSTEIRPALPNRLIVGDRVDARFTVMNRTDRLRKIEVEVGASGPIRGRPQATRAIEAEPFKRYTLSLPVEATGAGEIRFDVRAGDRADTDRLVTTLGVDLVAPLVTVAQHASTTDLWSEQTLEFPEAMRGDVGRVSVSTSPTAMGNLEGAFRYMRDYPYSCWEQTLTRGVMAAHYVRLRAHLSADLSWPEADGLTEAMLARAANYQAPGGGMSYFKPLDSHVSPYLSAYTALAFEWLRDRGHEIPPAVETSLHGYLETLLANDVFPSFYSRGMASSVRAVALAALARAGKLSEEDLLRYETHVPQMDLFGKAHYLLALEHLGGQAVLADRVRESILSMAHESAGKLVLSEQLDQGYARILHSDVRSSCAVLSALLAPGVETLESSGNAELPSKLVRTISARRGQRDRWENTQENLFCMNALIDYAERFEQQTPKLQVQLELDGKRLGRTRFESFADPAVEHGRAIDENDPGKRALLRVKRKGQGRLYYQTRISFAPDPPRTEPIRAGIEIRREYSVQQGEGWKLLDGSESLTRGDLIRVDLYLSLPAARNFVVVDDPVPGGVEPVNRELATSSQVDADQAGESYPPDAFFFEHDDWRSYAYSRWSFHHRELRHDAARFYSDYLPAGRYHLSYVAQVIAPGEFSAPPVRAEEMYDPDLFGLGIPSQLRVKDEQP